MRKAPLDKRELASCLDSVIDMLGPKATTLHVLPCDYETLQAKPGEFGLSKNNAGALVRVKDSRIITIIPRAEN